MTHKQPAQGMGVNAIYLPQIESGRRTGSAKKLGTIAEALSADPDALI